MPLTLDPHEHVIVRKGRKDHQCWGRRRVEQPHGPIHWHKTVRGNWVGHYPSKCIWNEHARGCPRTLPKGSEHIEYIGEVGPYRSGTRYSIECAADYCVDMTRDDLRAKIARRKADRVAHTTKARDDNEQ